MSSLIPKGTVFTIPQTREITVHVEKNTDSMRLVHAILIETLAVTRFKPPEFFILQT
jgi:hypothetical protein